MSIENICTEYEYGGMYCQCASCRHVVGVCIDHESGGGCAACDGPVTECDLTDYDENDASEELVFEM